MNKYDILIKELNDMLNIKKEEERDLTKSFSDKKQERDKSLKEEKDLNRKIKRLENAIEIMESYTKEELIKRLKESLRGFIIIEVLVNALILASSTKSLICNIIINLLLLGVYVKEEFIPSYDEFRVIKKNNLEDLRKELKKSQSKLKQLEKKNVSLNEEVRLMEQDLMRIKDYIDEINEKIRIVTDKKVKAYEKVLDESFIRVKIDEEYNRDDTLRLMRKKN